MQARKLGVPILALLLAAAIGPAAAMAGERCDLMFVNALDEEIGAIRVRYATPYDQPRHSSSQVFLGPGGEFRLGVQGTTLPERIIFDLATKTFYFNDLSGLNPDQDMRLEVTHQDGRPLLKRIDADGSATGEERDHLTAANLPNSVDRDFLTNAKTMAEVRELVEDATEEARERLGDVKEFTVEAGPIWNNDHAQSRCPEAAAEWNESNPGEARWNGQWSTTVPNEMSVCGCVAGAANLAGTLYEEDAGWGKTLYFPVFWKDWHGAARVQLVDAEDEEKGIGIDLRFRIPGEGVETMLDELLSDLRVDGYQPLQFQIKTWNAEKEERDEVELSFREGEGDKYDNQEKLQELLVSAYHESTLVQAMAIWVQKDTFDKLKAEEEPPAEPAVAVVFSRGMFEAFFLPDARMIVR